MTNILSYSSISCRAVILFLCISCWVFKVNAQRSIDSTKQLFHKSVYKDDKLKLAFTLVESYMDIDRYDSAQFWLNVITSDYLPADTTIFNYYLFSRQSEVYYYNGLHQLGITSANRALKIAKKLQDSILLMDAYNLLGLNELSNKSPSPAISQFLEAIRFEKLPPYDKQYISTTYPHHIYGNLAEAYFKLKQYDSAEINNRRSLHFAVEGNHHRGIGIAYYNLADIKIMQGQNDSVIYYAYKALDIVRESKDFDVELICYATLAKAYTSYNKQKVYEILTQGESLLKIYSQINYFFEKEFLSNALELYDKFKDLVKKSEVYRQLLNLEQERNEIHFGQMQQILNQSIETETKYYYADLIKSKQEKELQISRLYLLIVLLMLSAIILMFYQYTVRQKLKTAQLRNKLSRDLHDDLGATLSSIKMSSDVVEKMIGQQSDKAREQLKEISKNAEEGITTLSDLVWTMKSDSNKSGSIIERIKNHGFTLLSSNEIIVKYEFQEDVDRDITHPELKKNILLIVKEAFNNIAKHSNATAVILKLYKKNNDLHVLISDNGKGFDQSLISSGNGLDNIRKRSTDLGAYSNISSEIGKGTSISIVVPMKKY